MGVGYAAGEVAAVSEGVALPHRPPLRPRSHPPPRFFALSGRLRGWHGLYPLWWRGSRQVHGRPSGPRHHAQQHLPIRPLRRHLVRRHLQQLIGQDHPLFYRHGLTGHPRLRVNPLLLSQSDRRRNHLWSWRRLRRRGGQLLRPLRRAPIDGIARLHFRRLKRPDHQCTHESAHRRLL